MKEEISRLELIIGKILRIGVAIAIIFMLIGWILFIIENNKIITPYYSYLKVNDICCGMINLQPNAWLMGGLLILILTPVLRVITSIFAFIKVRDWNYIWITLLVLLILIIAILMGVIKN